MAEIIYGSVIIIIIPLLIELTEYLAWKDKKEVEDLFDRCERVFNELENNLNKQSSNVQATISEK